MIKDSVMPEVVTFVGGTAGAWKIVSIETITGPTMKRVARLDIVNGLSVKPFLRSKWLLRGVTSNEHYTTRSEHDKLITRQPDLGRAEATHAAMIPIRKSSTWWDLSQDERRVIFETRSGHIRMGLKYLPAIARRLYHCRDLGEPFDFLTWFEYAPSGDAAFNQLVTNLRGLTWKGKSIFGSFVSIARSCGQHYPRQFNLPDSSLESLADMLGGCGEAQASACRLRQPNLQLLARRYDGVVGYVYPFVEGEVKPSHELFVVPRNLLQLGLTMFVRGPRTAEGYV